MFLEASSTAKVVPVTLGNIEMTNVLNNDTNDRSE